MADDLVAGRVTSFRREQGFGVITLDDGRDVKFEAADCTMVPEEGAAVRLRVAPAKWGGGFTALHVEPRGSSILAVPGELGAARSSVLDEQIAALQREHLCAELSEHVMAKLVAEVFDGQLGDATLIDVLDAYYVEAPIRARHDGYLRHDRPFHHATDDILAEIAALLPRARLPRQVKWTTKARFTGFRGGLADTGETGPWAHQLHPLVERLDAGPRPEALGTLVVDLPDGKRRALDVDSLDEIVALVNDSLRAANDPRRMYPLVTEGDWQAFFVLHTERAKRLVGVLPFMQARR